MIINIFTSKEAFKKTMKVIKSCTIQQHLPIAAKMIEQFKLIYPPGRTYPGMDYVYYRLLLSTLEKREERLYIN